MSDTESEKDYLMDCYEDFEDNNCLKATYTFNLEFRTPFNLNKVDEYYVKWGILNVRIKDEWLEFQPGIEPHELEWKWADDTEVVDLSDTCLDDDETLKKYIEDSGHIVWECSTSRWTQKKKPKKQHHILVPVEDIRELTIDEAEEKMNEQQAMIKNLQAAIAEEKENSSYWRDKVMLEQKRLEEELDSTFSEDEKVAFDKALAN